MCDDVLSCARAESGDDSADRLYAAVPTASHAGGHAVKPDGTSTNRNAGEGNAARERTTRSSPDGHREIFSEPRLGADPRTPSGRLPWQRSAPPPAARGPAGDTDSSVDGGTHVHSPSDAMSARLASGASGLPPVDTPDCNTATGNRENRRTARSLSIDSGAAAAPDWSLALKKIVDHNEVDPRECQLPKGQVPERTSTPLRDDLYSLPYPSASLPFSLITRVPGRYFSVGQPPLTIAGHAPFWPAKWLNSRPPLTVSRSTSSLTSLAVSCSEYPFTSTPPEVVLRSRALSVITGA